MNTPNTLPAPGHEPAGLRHKLLSALPEAERLAALVVEAANEAGLLPDLLEIEGDMQHLAGVAASRLTAGYAPTLDELAADLTPEQVEVVREAIRAAHREIAVGAR